jgi:hypothetical protein
MTEATMIDDVIPRADIVKLAARVGAEIKNVKLSGDLFGTDRRRDQLHVIMNTGPEPRRKSA